jgi:hypothetical protein
MTLPLRNIQPGWEVDMGGNLTVQGPERITIKSGAAKSFGGELDGEMSIILSMTFFKN